VATAALSGEGTEELSRILDSHWEHLRGTGEGRERLKKQHATELQFWIQRHVLKAALDRVNGKAIEEMLTHKVDPATLGRRLLKI
jgi:putative protein kinase ArgK-like GTPase of G3E family